MIAKYFNLISQVIHSAVILLCSYIVAVYIEPIIYIIGYLPIETGKIFWVYFSIISVFCLIQILFRGLLQLLFSAPMITTSFVDILSFSPCLILIGDMSGYFSEIPYIPERIAPLFYLCIFTALHLFLKLITLFTSIYGKADSRWYSLGWFLIVFLLTYTSLVGFIQWKYSLIQHRFFQVKTSVVISDNTGKITTTEVPEGSFLIQPTSVSSKDNCQWFIRAGNKFLSTANIYLYIIFLDNRLSPCILPLQVLRDTWIEICIDDCLPEYRSNFIISWSSYRLPVFIVRHGLTPQFSLKSLEEARNFLFSSQKTEKAIYKSIYIDGPYCPREVTGEVTIK
ncbi:MAG: hypothetical protein ACP5UA_00765 [Candidatus Hydrogenedens sp.]